MQEVEGQCVDGNTHVPSAISSTCFVKNYEVRVQRSGRGEDVVEID